MTQEQKILTYMKTNGSITALEAAMYLKITRLSARIFDLRAEGHKIGASWVKDKNADGKKVQYLKYRLVE